MYSQLMGDFVHGLSVDADKTPCAQAYMQVNAALRKAPAITQAAEAFISKHLQQPQRSSSSSPGSSIESPGSRVESSGTGRGYLALQVRPYPDKCEALWMQLKFNRPLANSICANPYLMDNIVPSVWLRLQQLAGELQQYPAAGGVRSNAHADQLDADGSRHARLGSPAVPAAKHGPSVPSVPLFVMSHPKIRHHIMPQLLAAGLQPSFLDMDDLPQALVADASYAVTMLMMVEQEVCAHAAVYVGAQKSSITTNIMLQRAQWRMPNGTTTYMEEHSMKP